MVAGLNVHARIWRFTTNADDAVGGALLTGSVAYECLHSRFNMDRPARILRQQGIEVDQQGTALVRYTRGLVILEGDEYEIVGPTYHPQYSERWVVKGVEYPNVHPADRRGLVHLSLDRVERARTAKVQQ
jgi:hypothetical protein